MSMLAKCPKCHNKRSLKRKKCQCGEDLVKAARQKRVIYYESTSVDGKRKLIPLGRDLKEAKIAVRKREAQQDEGRMLPNARKTFIELTEWYLDLPHTRKLKAFRSNKSNLKIFNIEFGKVSVNSIKPVQLENFQEKLFDLGKSPGYIDQIFKHAKIMVTKAVDNDLFSADCLTPFKKIKKLLKKNANARNRILTPDEFESLIYHLPIHLKPMIAMGYYTGMRRHEILELTWDKIEDKTTIDLSPEDTKDSDRRLIPIIPELKKYMDTLPVALHNNHVFTFSGTHITEERLVNGLKAACEAAGILYGRNIPGGFTFHDLRHTFNTNMRKAGIHQSVIMNITGHSTDEMFRRYNTIDSEDATIAGAGLSDYFKLIEKEKKENERKNKSK